MECTRCRLPLCGGCYGASEHARMFMRCQDCGSPTHPTGAAGCAYGGLRVARTLGYASPAEMRERLQRVPVSPLQTPVQPADPVIRSTGLRGYSEHGEPEDWDLELGTITGYRWWKLAIPVSWAGTWDRYRGAYQPRILSDEELPYLTGGFSGKWKEGINTARCRDNANRRARGTRLHRPPEWQDTCGCGWWGYYNERLDVASVIGRNWRGKNLPPSGAARYVNVAVFGAIEGSGRVISGETGFRSQFAKIKAVALGRVNQDALSRWTDLSYPTGVTFATPDEITARYARIEDAISRRYPSVRVVSSQEQLVRLYPADGNPR